MLKQSNQASANALSLNLLTTWVTRYLPNLGLIPSSLRSHFEARISVVISPQSREITRNKILKNLSSNCAFAGLQAQKLMMEGNLPLVFNEAKELGEEINNIYEYLLQCYVDDFVFSPVLEKFQSIDSQASRKDVAAKILPAFDRLMKGLEPSLIRLQKKHLQSNNLRAIGFLTTQLHLTRKRVLDGLDAYERIWLSPYLQLTEELVCMPWRRICEAAKRGYSRQAEMGMVEMMLPKAESIALNVYQRAMRTYSTHISRQGWIHSEAVQRSSLRDLNMFQAYIWLVVLERNLSVIENELLPLCLLVFPCSDVRWQLVESGIKWLCEDIQTHLNPQQRVLFSYYAKLIQSRFSEANPDQVDIKEIHRLLQRQVA